MNEISDVVLIEQIGAGQKAAMKALYERHSTSLYRFLLSRAGDPFEAADLMQETFIEVWRGAARFQGRSAVRTWLFGIARNKAIDRLRRSGREIPQEPDDTLADESPNAAAVVEAASDAAKVRACLEGLSPPHRSAIELAFYQELSYPQVAEVEGVPVGTIKTRIHHAKQLLKRCLAAFAITF